MTDYSKNEDYAAKDALATGDPDKLILGSDIGGELDELVTAVASKYDSSDIASQAQTLAGVDNTTLITPLRLQQKLAGSGGALADIAALTDPGADRLLMWDETPTDGVVWASLGTGLTTSGAALALNLGAIDHDSLLNWLANKHIDHTTVSILTPANSGLAGGGTIAASRTLVVDIASLTTASIDSAADYVMFLDATDSVLKKSLITNVAGTALGDGAWYLNVGQALTAATEATLIWDTASYNSLQRGTFSLVTGIYTAGSSGARIQVTVQCRVTSIGSGRTLLAQAYHNSTSKLYNLAYNYADSTSTELCVGFTFAVTLAAGDTMTIKATASSACTLTAGEKYNKLTIVELA